MALAPFEDMRSAQEIVALALVRAGSPSKQLNAAGDEALDAIAYLELQLILDGIATDYDWPYTRVIRTLTVSGRTTPLPREFWRVSFDDPMWWLDGCGGRIRMHLDDEPGFFSSLSAPATRGTPIRFWIHKQNQVLYVEPIPTAPGTVEFHFQPWHIPLDDITSKPWFPHAEYLVSALASKLCLGQDDQRAMSEDALATRLMTRIRRGQGDQGDRTHSIPYNPVHFRPMRKL